MPSLALFVAMRIAASWRPSPIGKLTIGADQWIDIQAARDRVSFGGNDKNDHRFYGWLDLSSGKVAALPPNVPRRTGQFNGYRWVYLLGDKAYTLEVTDPKGVTRSYIGPASGFPGQKDELPVRILPARNLVMLVCNGDLLQWNYATGRLLKKSESRANPLSRDAKTGVDISDRKFEIVDVASDKVLKTVPWRTPGPLEYEYFSRYGRYCLFDSRDGTLRVVEVASGQMLWKFPADSIFDLNALMSDDEKTIVVPMGNQWQVRDFRSGVIVRRLAALPNVEAAALAPDGAILYSVAHGTLYRQRVR